MILDSMCYDSWKMFCGEMLEEMMICWNLNETRCDEINGKMIWTWID
jgi:hypothetical protein